MKSTLQIYRNQRKVRDEGTYATADDFRRLFASEMTDLFRLSMRLTADAEKAERCLILAIRECMCNSTVSRGWALIWARRTVIRNAIRLVSCVEAGAPSCDSDEEGHDFDLQPGRYRIEAMGDSLPILSLPDFDRLVFVICVLERYSIMDCALLLARSPQDVNYVRARAINQVVSADHRNRGEHSASIPGTSINRLGVLNDSCGSLFD